MNDEVIYRYDLLYETNCNRKFPNPPFLFLWRVFLNVVPIIAWRSRW